MPEIIFHPDVAAEIKSAYGWYQGQAEGLGEDFLLELESAYHVIVKLPDTWPIFQKKLHRYLLRKFPFSVIYRLDMNIIYVIAVMHNSRKPGYWRTRF